MKPGKLFMLLPALLIAATSALYAIPEGEENPRESLTLISATEMLELTSLWADQYVLSYPDVTLEVKGLSETGMQELIQQEGRIGLLTRDQLRSLGDDPARIMAMGREVIVPVISSRNPQREEVLQTGIAPGTFSRNHHLVCSKYVAENYLVGFLPADEGQTGYTLVDGTEALLEYLSRNPQAVGFCPLIEIMNSKADAIVEDLTLVPLDMNNNARIDHMEDIYKTPADLLRGIWIGKYPKVLSHTIYAVTGSHDLGVEETSFLEWMASEGQELLADQGYIAITHSERQAVGEKLAGNPGVVSHVRAEAKPARVILLTVGALLALFLILLYAARLFGRREFAYDTGSKGLQAASAGEGSGIPGGIFFDRSHTWAFLEMDGKVRVGIDDFLQNVTGPITRVVVKNKGEKIKKGETLLKLVQRGKQLEIKSPVTGMVAEQNQELMRDSSAINSSPYTEGWICTVEPADWMKDLKAFLRGDHYTAWIRKEVVRLKDFLSAELSVAGKEIAVPVMQDGGEIKDNVLEEFGPEVWEDFQGRFINASN